LGGRALAEHVPVVAELVRASGPAIVSRLGRGLEDEEGSLVEVEELGGREVLEHGDAEHLRRGDVETLERRGSHEVLDRLDNALEGFREGVHGSALS
jgi:hypothetical protein